MSVSTRRALNWIRIIGGAVCFAIVIWIWIHPKAYSPIDLRFILFIIAGFPAGAAATALVIDKKSEI